MTDALKPCPFCGPGNSVPGLWFDDTTNAYRVNCGACGSGTGFKPGWTEAEAIAAWNRRAPEPSPATDALADELERLVKKATTQDADKWLHNAVEYFRREQHHECRIACETGIMVMALLPTILSAFREREPVATDIGQGNHDCLTKRRPGEPMFILLGRDPDAHNIVRLWGERRLQAGGDKDHCEQAFATAARMQAYASDPANRPASAPDASAYPAPASTPEPTALREREPVACQHPSDGGCPACCVETERDPLPLNRAAPTPEHQEEQS